MRDGSIYTYIRRKEEARVRVFAPALFPLNPLPAPKGERCRWVSEQVEFSRHVGWLLR